MHDRTLRGLERRVGHATTSTADRVALLRALLRAGQVTEEQVTLAAYCGHQTARSLLARCSCPCGWAHGTMTVAGAIAADLDHTDSQDIDTWFMGLKRWGYRTVAYAGTAAALGSSEAMLYTARTALDLVAHWCRCPCAHCAGDVMRWCRDVAPAPTRFWFAATEAVYCAQYMPRTQSDQVLREAIRQCEQLRSEGLPLLTVVRRALLRHPMTLPSFPEPALRVQPDCV